MKTIIFLSFVFAAVGAWGSYMTQKDHPRPAYNYREAQYDGWALASSIICVMACIAWAVS